MSEKEKPKSYVCCSMLHGWIEWFQYELLRDDTCQLVNTWNENETLRMKKQKKNKNFECFGNKVNKKNKRVGFYVYILVFWLITLKKTAFFSNIINYMLRIS